jgi:hypothetical protein
VAPACFACIYLARQLCELVDGETRDEKARDSLPVLLILAADKGRPQVRFLECGTRSRGWCTGRVVTDDARLVGEERPLATRADDGRYTRRSIGNPRYSARTRG